MKHLKIFKNSRVIVTGHTGFKGSWLTAWLKELGAHVMGISINIPTKPSHYKVSNINDGIKDIRIDIRNKKKIEKTIVNFKPKFLFHLAAQSLVGESYNHPINTWETNVIGTLNILNALRKLKNKCNAIIITSDKCYLNRETHIGYKESDVLGGKDPYSASKASAELVVKSYINSFFSNDQNYIRIATARAGNVIGGGDWANFRIIPDCVRSWSQNKAAELRTPNATRPWQHVLEAISGYLCLATNLNFNDKIHGESFNFGPQISQKEYSVLKLVKSISLHWNNVDWKIKSKSKKNFYESSLLRLNCNKAQKILKWKSVLKFNETTEFVSKWYKNFYENPKNIHITTTEQIKKYHFLAGQRGLKWVKNF